MVAERSRQLALDGTIHPVGIAADRLDADEQAADNEAHCQQREQARRATTDSLFHRGLRANDCQFSNGAEAPSQQIEHYGDPEQMIEAQHHREILAQPAQNDPADIRSQIDLG